MLDHISFEDDPASFLVLLQVDFQVGESFMKLNYHESSVNSKCFRCVKKFTNEYALCLSVHPLQQK